MRAIIARKSERPSIFIPGDIVLQLKITRRWADDLKYRLPIHGDFVILEFALSTLISIFAIINPMGAVPNYAVLTQGYSLKDKRMVIKKAILVAGGILVIFALLGKLIFEALNITVDGFRVAGGAVLFLIAMEMVRGNTPQAKLNPKEKKENLEKDQIGVVPLGIPLLAGPGSITTVMIAVADSPTNKFLGIMIVIASVLLVLLFSYFVLRNTDRIFKRLGRTGTKIFSRIMGLLLGAIAVQFIADGIKGLFGL
ncbi:MAG: MarC family protein [Candidatus Thermoplasmatota archaeon]|nr:MarC family protein [Candidatus Thermoplasmatota archaeon]